LKRERKHASWLGKKKKRFQKVAKSGRRDVGRHLGEANCRHASANKNRPESRGTNEIKSKKREKGNTGGGKTETPQDLEDRK